MTKEQFMIFDSKLEKLNAEDIMYFKGFLNCIQFMENDVFHYAEKDAYNMKDNVMRYPFTRLLFNMKDALQEKLVDELFRKMDQTIEEYKKEEQKSLDDYLIEPEWLTCDDDCKHCTVAGCTHRTDVCMDPGSILPDSSIDFMNIGGNKDD